MIDDGLRLVSESLWGDENLHDMTGDTTTPEGRQCGSERPRRHHFGASKNASTPLWKWGRTALSEALTFSDFYDVSNELDSVVLNCKRVLCSECIVGEGTSSHFPILSTGTLH